ncbi:MAG: UDP-2,3-diacylglucosamine diphosphatase [Paludibacteraceae bacterium]|nr:UDP-2,3-diacylglucosamine diphosphatase [Paludibacteraceae bacterium]
MIYFLSDIHLGSLAFPDASAHERRFIRLLEKLGRDATEIYLLGDVFDYYYEYFFRFKSPFPNVFAALKSLTDKGIKVHFFVGNHDIWTFGKLARETGVVVHHKEETLMVGGKRCFLAHGDGLGSTDKKFLALRRFFHNPVAQFLFRFVPPCLGDKLGYTWAKHSRLKEMDGSMPYKGENREELVLFAKEMEKNDHHDFYIFGHRHIDLELQLKTGAEVIILGDYFKLFTYAQMDKIGQVGLIYDI